MDGMMKLWRGEQSLKMAFWFFGVIIKLVLFLILNSVNTMAKYGLLPPAAFYLLLSLMMVYNVVCYVGIWRSASRYDGVRIWAVLAKIYVAVFALLLIYDANVLLGVGKIHSAR